MDEKQQQSLGILFVSSFLSLTASRIIHSNGSNLMDFSQGILTGMGLVGMVLTIITYGRYKKRSQ
ncbi:hypothetical protein KIH86_10130 [Paenibacillus sp. HN-1]|uniref:hypothetical protein n=1 Tax=Paenibacillus TaxID=44249 RepID=UPI001CA9D149|nr:MULTISPECIES: hypothetical protein [Paenibacillus]MBY9079946.1 hypothetical protein [Paenibacillus sp. CGMCC 1.18879]MBY9084588.1 hypothetical protein [Paenibacillus sinensis]